MKRRILVVDDSFAMRRMLGATLEAAGYEICQASNGSEALAVLDAGGVDLIVSDVNMPEMDGISFVRKARSRAGSRFLPIIMLTTENTTARVLEGRDAGATGWLVKPFHPAKLVEVVAKFLV